MRPFPRVVRRYALGVVVAAVACVMSMPAGNAQAPAPAPREVPAHPLPVPDTVSPQMQALVGGPLAGNWNVAPTTVEEWKPIAAPSAGRGLPALRERFGVKTEPMTLNGVSAFMVTPNVIRPEN